MKKLTVFLFSVFLVLNFAGNVKALSFTDSKILNKWLTGTGSYGWSHKTPSDFEVPYDKVNGASLDIYAMFVDNNDDQIFVDGSFYGRLENTKLIWDGGLNIVGSHVKFADSFFNPWLNGDPLDVNLSYIESIGCKSLYLAKSVFKLNYENMTGPTSVPEPESMLMLGSVLLGLVAVSRKRFNHRN